MKGLVDSKYWTDFGGFKYQLHTENNPNYQFINRFIKSSPDEKGECIELGSYPGSMTAHFGELGYAINGIDIHPENSRGLPQWLKSKGYAVGDFITGDIFELDIRKKFDIVCSFGLIEHFENYLEVIDIHDRFLKHGGKLIITTPNFRGFFQKFIYKYFYPEVYKIHNIESMQPLIWAEYLRKKGYQILFSGYFGGFKYWINPYEKSFIPKNFLRLWLRCSNFLNRKLKAESKYYSQQCGIVAVKNEET